MTFAHTDEQRMLADSIVAALGNRAAPAWEEAVDALGLDLLGVAVTDGGLGIDLRDAAVVAEAFGALNTGLPWAERWAEKAGAHEDALTLLHCAELIGLCRTLLRDTALYLRERKQFGVPIATFQALRHRMADMAMWLEQASALTNAALDTPDDPTAVSAARVLCDDAAKAIGEGAVQLHGAMGLTAELRVGGYFRRVRALMQHDGGGRAHLTRYAEAAPEPA